MTSTFRVLYVLVIIEHHSRRLIHYNVTAHPSAQWTRQQLREAIGYERRYEYLIHDRDSIFSADLDESIQRLGLRVLKSPPGLARLEDKILQRAVLEVLNAIYEEDFLGFSYGFRSGRGPASSAGRARIRGKSYEGELHFGL